MASRYRLKCFQSVHKNSMETHNDKFILTTHSSTHPLIRLSMGTVIFLYGNFQINFNAAGWDVKKTFCIHHGMRKIQTDIYDSMAWVVRGQNFRFLGIFFPLLPLTHTLVENFSSDYFWKYSSLFGTLVHSAT